MNLRAAGLRKARRQPSFTWLLLVIAVLMMAHISFAQDTTANDPAPTTDVSTKETTKATTHDDTTTTSKTTKESTTDKPATTTTTESSTSTDSSTTSTATNDYPVVTVPPLADAPYMQTSDTPEGTVFIAVGAVLGFLGLALLAWRGMVAWSEKEICAPLAWRPSTSRLLGKDERRASHKSPLLQGPKIQQWLVLLPHGWNAQRRKQRFKLSSAGYYAAGNAAAGSGSHQSMQFSAPDLPGMGPQAQGYTRTKSGPSPPGTPTHAPGGVYEPQFNTSRYSHVASNSSVNLASPTQGRTPSAYLEDLFENPPPHNRQ
ncbi:hypothetical protein ANOM_004852 [Aspergillus nomiae NRRL 13137]|uniref:Uncharacterized protein n=1 Tax=Aspergillus nomiae NRRL (strain ATCC 15546 / NRRL 13137 / CBS 260.88 / M93) TaxID=1509407 RepID=A0A0L1J3V3_ASPN3|nr:uncharacterized protein ANOM_004852 [Aspergillus nomiae NRRL 13137]KNG86113.1 hypothetical protein ANOM_004852 [Aspergillus nomiae NRRL 13137]